MKEQKYIVLAIAILAVAFLPSCSPSVHLAQNEYLLKSTPGFKRISTATDTTKTDSLSSSSGKAKKVKTEKISIEYDDLYYAIKTQPNRKMVVIKPYLLLYNLGYSMRKNDYKIERLYKWLFPQSHALDSLSEWLENRIGEKPVVIDTAFLNKDIRNLESIYFANGFFHPEIISQVDTCKSYLNRKQGRVTFLIVENEAWVIDKVEYQIEEKTIQRLIEVNQEKSLIQPGDLYNEDNLSSERARISGILRNNGYFKFMPSMITYEIDTFSIRDTPVEIKNKSLENCRQLRVIVKIPEEQKIYTIQKLTLFIKPSHLKEDDNAMLFRPANLSPELRKELKLSQKVLNDSLEMTMKLYEHSLDRLNVNLLDQRFAIREGQIYKLDHERRTIRNLNELGIFRFSVVNYEANDSLGTLEAIVSAQLTERYQFKTGLEGFTQNDQSLRTNLPGIGGNLNFRDKMFFKGAEKLDITTKGALSFLYLKNENKWQTFYEIGVKANLSVPRLMLPIFNTKNLTSYNPSTSFSANLNSQERSLYQRTIFGMNWNYSFYNRENDLRSRSSVSPYIINFIQSTLDSVFQAQIDSIESPFLRSFTILDFQPRFSSKFNYKYSWSNFQSTRDHATTSFLGQVEFGGNTPWLIDRFFSPDASYRDGNLNGIYYGQFVKLSAEYKRYHPITKKTEFVWRIFSGIADPWNFSKQVPFDARFFAGGTNSMRGWASNTLGPGTWNREENLPTNNGTIDFLISPGGEFSFEANAEIRANVYKFIELAIFTDIGNVWFLPTSNFDFENGKLTKDTFYQLGWDMGLGFRFDFSFFIFRIDLAQQLYAPDKSDFVIKSFPKDLGGNRFQLNFGIGYPF